MSLMSFLNTHRYWQLKGEGVLTPMSYELLKREEGRIRLEIHPS
jgi:hypothetical protein